MVGEETKRVTHFYSERDGRVTLGGSSDVGCPCSRFEDDGTGKKRAEETKRRSFFSLSRAYLVHHTPSRSTSKESKPTVVKQL